MTKEELRQAAVDYLGKAFKGDTVGDPTTIQAAVAVALAPKEA